jgi:hypothetical protein
MKPKPFSLSSQLHPLQGGRARNFGIEKTTFKIVLNNRRRVEIWEGGK